MEKMMRCKVCGYITPESKIKEVCDACGVPKSFFEEYVEKVSPRRKRILDLHLHPIAVHFPQALASLIPMLILAGLIPGSGLRSELLTTARVLTVILPFSIIGAGIAGFIDGKTRFKRLRTPLLVRKVVLSATLFALSVVMCVLVLASDLESGARYIVLALSLGCIGCELPLGNAGIKLMYAKLPG